MGDRPCINIVQATVSQWHNSVELKLYHIWQEPAENTQLAFSFLMFVCPCIVSIIRNWWPTRCKFWFIYLYPISCTCFRRYFRPSSGALDCIYSFWYSPPMFCRPVSRHLVHDTSQQQHRWTITEAVNTVKCSWWWAKTSPETCTADWVQINKPKICILLVINYEQSWPFQYI